MIPSDLLYTEEHEWLRIEGDTATIGITSHATDELGEIVYVDLPPTGEALAQMDEFGTVESVKTLSSLYIPVGGEVIDVNEQAAENPALISDSPFTEGWLIKIKMNDPEEVNELLSADDYQLLLDR